MEEAAKESSKVCVVFLGASERESVSHVLQEMTARATVCPPPKR